MLWLLTKCMISHDYSSVTADQENSSLAVTVHWEILNWLTGSVNCDQSLLASPVWGGGEVLNFPSLRKITMMLNFDLGKVSFAPIVLDRKVDMIRHKSSPCLLLVLQKCSDLKDLLLWNPKNQIKIWIKVVSSGSTYADERTEPKIPCKKSFQKLLKN